MVGHPCPGLSCYLLWEYRLVAKTTLRQSYMDRIKIMRASWKQMVSLCAILRMSTMESSTESNALTCFVPPNILHDTKSVLFKIMGINYKIGITFQYVREMGGCFILSINIYNREYKVFSLRFLKLEHSWARACKLYKTHWNH